jgi:hypothetical protein
MSLRIVQALTVAFQFVGQAMPDAALEEMAVDLAAYAEADVLAALKRCRSELKVIRYGDVLDRISGGHPGAEEAWAIVAAAIGPRGLEREDASTVWTDEMRDAFGVALALGSDQVAARMAFKEVYAQRVSAARANRQRPQWAVSLGYDPQGREVAVQQALSKNQISQEYAARLLPHTEAVAPEVQALLEQIGK